MLKKGLHNNCSRGQHTTTRQYISEPQLKRIKNYEKQQVEIKGFNKFIIGGQWDSEAIDDSIRSEGQATDDTSPR